MTGQPPTRRSEPDAATVRLDQRRPDFVGQRRDLLRDRRRRHPERVRDRVHGAESRQREQEFETAYVHSHIMNDVSMILTWTRMKSRASLEACAHETGR